MDLKERYKFIPIEDNGMFSQNSDRTVAFRQNFATTNLTAPAYYTSIAFCDTIWEEYTYQMDNLVEPNIVKKTYLISVMHIGQMLLNIHANYIGKLSGQEISAMCDEKGYLPMMHMEASEAYMTRIKNLQQYQAHGSKPITPKEDGVVTPEERLPYLFGPSMVFCALIEKYLINLLADEIRAFLHENKYFDLTAHMKEKYLKNVDGFNKSKKDYFEDILTGKIPLGTLLSTGILERTLSPRKNFFVVLRSLFDAGALDLRNSQIHVKSKPFGFYYVEYTALLYQISLYILGHDKLLDSDSLARYFK